MPEIQRILIDCFLVDFSRQPTGIPRVVLKYIETAYAWAAQRGIEVLPAVPEEGGMRLVVPVPGRNAPAASVAAAHAPCVANGATFGAADLGDLPSLLAALGRAAAPSHTGTRNSPLVIPGPGDLVFCPAYWHDVNPAIYQSYAAAGAKIVILVHDILPITLPRFYNAPWCHDFRRNVIAAFRYADAFCTVSDHTRRGLTELGLREGQRSVPMMTAYNGFEPLVGEEALQHLDGTRQLPDSPAIVAIKALDRFYVMVGSIDPKKGHVPVLACFEAMWGAGLASHLVIIGRRGWLEREVVDAIEGSPWLGERLHWFSGLDDFELGQVYRQARALVFASAGEGFGIPMIEAAAYGRPVLAYDTPIVQEILGDAALRFTDGVEFVEQVATLEQDGPYAKAAVTASGTAWPSWEAYTPGVYEALRAHFEDGAPLPDRAPGREPPLGHAYPHAPPFAAGVGAVSTSGAPPKQAVTGPPPGLTVFGAAFEGPLDVRRQDGAVRFEVVLRPEGIDAAEVMRLVAQAGLGVGYRLQGDTSASAVVYAGGGRLEAADGATFRCRLEVPDHAWGAAAIRLVHLGLRYDGLGAFEAWGVPGAWLAICPGPQDPFERFFGTFNTERA